MIRTILLFSFLAFLTSSVSMADFNQQYNINGSVKDIINTEVIYKETKNTVTIDNKKYNVYVDDSNKQYYKIDGKYVPIINTEINKK